MTLDVLTAGFDRWLVRLWVVRTVRFVSVADQEGTMLVSFPFQELPVVTGVPGLDDDKVFSYRNDVKVCCVN